ncbi:MAG TPA: universal stress protein [Gaiella sp.]|jgi:nucleotide-binding universal stress UspA family protein|nr:universal stress protein [Gaiella sp.]
MRTIVVGYDGEQSAERALDRAIEDARDSKGRLVVVAVSEMLLDPEGPQNFGTLDDSPARMIPLVEPPELEPVFVEARQRIEAAGVKADYVWGVGDPATTIVNAATDRKADVVVLGAHHHGFLSRILGADVASEVKRSVGCDVVVVD